MYKSKKPTKTKKQFYNFMERNKNHGVVGRKKVGEYIKRNGLIAYNMGAKKGGGTWVDIKNKNGTLIAELLVKHNQIVWWDVQ